MTDTKAGPAGGASAAHDAAPLTEAERKALEEKFDSEVRFRPLTRPILIASSVALFVLACFHYYTAGFGILQQTTHNGLHLAFTLGLVFAVFSWSGRVDPEPARSTPLAPLGLPLLDWAFLIGGVVSALYVPWVFDTLAMRVGNPNGTDIVMGTVLIATLLEATRRAMGWPLPVIAIGFMAYAYFGRSMPGIMQHPGANWPSLVNHLYLTSQGIYGTALGVIATYVFHFVLFGVLATRIGLGQLFIDLASALAGRYAGGPAKVSVLSSAMLGSISGSSIANTVTTGSLTIPAMIKIGYKRHFAAAVEAASSTGGQITPPVMGAVAFLMIEYLEVPLTTILTAALVPAFMHFFGVLVQVHMEAKRLGLRGLTKEELPDAWLVFKSNWLAIAPLVVLVWVLLSGRTPYAAAFWGISACIGVMIVQNLMARGLADAARGVATDVFEGFVLGAKYSLSVTVAAALVGVVIGVVTLTGVGFKIVYLVTTTAAGWAEAAQWLIPFGIMEVQTLTLLFTLMMTAVVCILMGCGIPTTANYLIMIAIAAPILNALGVEPIVSHFFVFYYGVLADVTPPVALAAYAAAGIAGANAFKAGNTAFRLSMGKALVPFVFVFSPSLLLVTQGFTWPLFALALSGAMLGITALSAAFSGYLTQPLLAWERALLAVAALLFVAPDLVTTLVAAALCLPVLVRGVTGWGRAAPA